MGRLAHRRRGLSRDGARGPWPATSSPGATSVGTLAVERWLRPVCYQSFPDALLPSELRDDNPLRAPRQTGAGLIQGA
ncbi:hypothetical protein Smic_85920 [Streptomyces microflavus]|uniref:NADP-dependent aldehyde dehydrogenase n=1 Tax=Streptomyces microflavus TaxID=1919 RepID=A0A7J0D5Q0_STRMI|nr:hypothetical protein Smic_85920 [Streptomyces microflavus]